MALTTKGFLDAALERWLEWDLNQGPLNKR